MVWESLADHDVGEPRMSSSLLGVAVPITSMPHVGTHGNFSCRVALTSQLPVGTGCLLLVENVSQVSTFLAEGHPVPGGQIHYKTDPLVSNILVSPQSNDMIKAMQEPARHMGPPPSLEPRTLSSFKITSLQS